MRTRRMLVTALTLAAVVASGCAGRRTPAPAEGNGTVPGTAPPASGWLRPDGGTLVGFTREGGLAGLDDRLTVLPTGQFTLARSRPAVHRTGRLTDDERATLDRVLRDADVGVQPTHQPGRGADAFTYDLTYASREIVAQDGGVVATLQPVIDALVAIVERYGS